MTETFPGRTAWETRQYRRNHGRRAAVALEYKLFADFLHGDEDGPVPMRDTIIACAAPPSAGKEDGCAAVDRWAARHHVTAGWDNGSYSAEVPFGPDLKYRVVFVPMDVLDEHLDAQGVPGDSAEMAGSAAAA